MRSRSALNINRTVTKSQNVLVKRMKLTALEIAVLRKMYMHNFIGEKHTSADNIPKGFPKHQRGEIKNSLKKLTRQGYVIPKVTSYGMEVSLNPRKIIEIRQLIGNE